MARLLALFVLLAYSGLALAGGNVAVIPNSTVYRAIWDEVLGSYMPTSDAAVSDVAAKYIAKNPGGNSSNACAYTNSASLSGPGQITKTVTFSSRPGYVCTNQSTSTQFSVGIDSKKTNVCPANASGSPMDSPTSCTCDAAFKPDSAAKACIPDCTADERTSTGWYDVGTDSSKYPPLVACSGKCRVSFMGNAPEESEVVGGG